MRFPKISLVLAALCTFAWGACGDGDDRPLLEAKLDQANFRLNITVHPGLAPGQTLHVRVREGGVGVLECETMANQIPRIDNAPAAFGPPEGDTFVGPFVDPGAFTPIYDNSWLESEPTPQMIAQASSMQRTIDICIMDGDEVIRNAEMDIQRALDAKGTGKFDGYGDPDEQISSVVAYAQACVSQLGEIPFFEKIEDGDYKTFNCLDATPIPTTVTQTNGEVSFPETQSNACDHPQFIYNSCEPNAVDGRTNGPRVTRAVNAQGTYWVLLCRKAKTEEGSYNDMAMIGHNPYTGKTCYFQNGLYVKTDGLNITHPADEIDSTTSPQQSAHIWSGIQGGIGSGIECVKCHDSDPFIHTPWIDGAKDANGDPMVPKMGIHDGLALGFNEAPYSLIDLEGQGWTMPKQLTSPEAAACTKCHRIGDGRWARSWMRRLEGEDVTWNNLLTDAHKKFAHVFWMPPEVEGIDEETWAESEYGKAFTFIQNCASNTDDPACKWEELPVEQVLDFGELPTIELEGAELALEALKIVGAQVSDSSDPRCTGENGSCANRRCAECHSVSKNGLRHWRGLTTTAENSCGLKANPDEMTEADARKAVDCLRAQPDDPESVFAADKLGILATGARYGYFRKLFQKAFGPDNWLQPFVRFKSRVNMPKGTYPALSQREYATVVKWYQQGLPSLDQLVLDPPAPSTCEPYMDTEAMAKHIENMKYEGWKAVNAENGIAMYGCPLGSNGKCFTDAIDRKAEFGGGASGRLIEVLKLDFRTSFWTRSSADGRFIANGGGSDSRSTVTDMVRGLDVKINASYDPGFFPDNSGFIFQGGGTNICTQGMLETVTEVDWEDPRCMKGTNINLYQHVARGLKGGDYFIINSQFTSDSGGNSDDPKAFFNAQSTMKFSPMIFNGTTYEQLPAVVVDSPFEGDSVLSPSGEVVISRLAGPEGKSLGYVLRRVSTERFDDNYIIKTDQLLARICTPGAKANISYDERFFVTHHYENGAANIYLVDLLTGAIHKITNMPEGVKALFPHFRSDNWFYFLVKDKRDGDKEYILASDLAVELEHSTP